MSPRIALLPAILVALSISLAACDARVREIRSSLGPEELRTFDRGRQLAAPCWTCHDLYTETNKVGPHLVGLFGRRIGAVPGFYYSEAFRAKDLVWTPETVRAYLGDVRGFIPGTTMVSPGVGSREEVDAVVYYLGLVTRP